MNCWKIALFCLCIAYVGAGHSNSPPRKENSTNSQQALGHLRVVTWNVEHLAFPIDKGCKPRSSTDLGAMRQYVNNIDADIVALQEVASEQAVELLFPKTEWKIVVSGRPNSKSYDCRGSSYTSTQQKVAFAVRHSVKVLAVEQNSSFSLDSPSLRYALGLTVDSLEGPIDLLNLHLKSGCFVDDFLSKESEACKVFSRQAPVLDQWIEQREKENRSYIVLGDFNHRISAPYNRLAQTITKNSNGAPSTLKVATQPLIGCHPRYPAPIDHIIVGGKRINTSVTNPKVHYYKGKEDDAMLSDHCAVSVDFFEQGQRLSTAVKWQTTSKEYQLLLRALYQGAGEALKRKALPKKPWVVVMDLDETVIDNSAYQVNLDKSGRFYTPATWAQWVMSEQAALVPGARDFIDLVLSLGGRLALVTNRNKQLDAHTWRNLVALELPISAENTCLLGRAKSDKLLNEKEAINNDKDKRRLQIRSGSASCYFPGEKHSNWQVAHQIVFQVGDNIEDIGGVTQEDANPVELLKRWGNDVLILPNPMYGSW